MLYIEHAFHERMDGLLLTHNISRTIKNLAAVRN